MNAQARKVFAELGLDEGCLLSDLGTAHISDANMTILCENMMSIEYEFVQILVSHPDLKESHVDILIHYPRAALMLELGTACKVIKPRHIETLLTLAGDTKWGYAGSRTYISDLFLRHPVCTEAMKVKYHLTRG